MENLMRRRLVEYIKSIDMSIREFERSIGAANGYVNGITRGISAERLREINRVYPTLNTDWLLTGEGEMLTSHVEQTNVNGDNNNFSTVNKADDKLLAELANAHKLTENAQEQVNRLISIIEKMQNNH